ncbi:hypothetical protein LEMLEM_LOCUS5440 [Lemmus lemmus]
MQRARVNPSRKRERAARVREAHFPPPPRRPPATAPRHATHLKSVTRSQRREKSLVGTFLSDQGPKAAEFPSLRTKEDTNLQLEFRTRTEHSADVSIENTRGQRGACAQTSARWGGLSSRPIAIRQARSAGGFRLRLRDAHARRGRHATPPPPHSIRAFEGGREGLLALRVQAEQSSGPGGEPRTGVKCGHRARGDSRLQAWT